MCLIALAMGASPELRLVVIANRDEFLARPTAALHRWTDGSGIIAGADLEAGGTWLGMHPENGRVAMVTNVRDPSDLQLRRENERSRGVLVRDFLVGDDDAAAYVKEAAADKAMRGFNLIAVDAKGAFWSSNRGGKATRLEAGIYGLSNASLDTPWPKVVRAKEALREILSRHALSGPGPLNEDALFDVLGSTERAPDDSLPDTGVGRELERALSPIRVAWPKYGTRCSTVLSLGLVRGESRARLVERTLGPGPVSEVVVESAFRGLP